MADRAKKREKHRLKRLKKNRETRKLAAITPLRHLARSGGTLECWITENWKEEGMANLFVFGTDSRGGHALASFLIDGWCVGLKDVFGLPQAIRPEFDK